MSNGVENNVSRYRKPRKLNLLSVVVNLFIVTAASGYLLFVNAGKAEPTLRFVSVLFRHGDRNPYFTYPKDPYKNVTRFFPEGLGQLTNRGKRTEFTGGKLLRKRYNGYISSTYSPFEVYVLSSEVDRCIMSAQCLMAGLFPPKGAQVWNEDLLWQPAVEHPLPSSVDDIIVVSKPCAALTRKLDRVMRHQVQKQLDEKRDLIDYLSENTGMDMNNVTDLEGLYDTLSVDLEQGLKLPEWAETVYPEKLKPFFFISETADTATLSLKRLVSGVLIHDIVTNMMEKRASKRANKDLRMNLYSGHDTTIIRLWRSMGVRQRLPKPNYGAEFVVELHEINGQWRVKLLYKNYALDTRLSVINIEGCEEDEEKHGDGACDLDIFASVLKPVTLSDSEFDEECNKTHSKF